ncbi:MAG: copper amine oxidase N-terminal domain-containing protein [Syntrophomonas sp.]|nr:copper amine oxidase N-terminal domain-containing protein [Syntrophomonas sp.]
MNRKFTLPLALLFILVMAAPVYADVQLDVNGRTYDSASKLNIQDGITSAPVDVLAHTLGCTVTLEGDTITMQENQNTLKMTLGSNTALFNGQEKQMLRPPQSIEGQVYVPARFVYECFGASVAWQDVQKLISVAYAETRDGMTAEELLTQASQKMVEVNRYKMSADSSTDMDMTTQENGKNPENMKMQTDSLSDCWIQSNPVLMYMKQNTTIKAITPESTEAQENPKDILMEMVFNDSGMYMTMPEFGWVKMDLPGMNIQELMKQSMSQDAAATMKQMKDLGMSISFANDREKNGQKYWVIDTVMGGDIFKSDYIKQFTKTITIPEAADLQKIFAGMDADISYSTWINQKTLCTDFMEIQEKIKMDMDNPDAEEPGNIKMEMNMKGTYTMSDYGLTFQVPDVSKAVDYEKFIDQQK